MELFLPFVKVTIGFIICSAITTAAGYLTFLAFLAYGEIAFLKSSDARAIPFVILFGAIFLGIYPSAAWLLRDDLRAITPGWLFSDALVILFGCSIFIWASALKIYVKFAKNWRKWFPKNGEKKTFYRTGELWKVENWKNNLLNGEVCYFCQDGRIYFSATFNLGKKIGRVYSTVCEKFDIDKTESFFDTSGNLFSKKEFFNNRLVKEYLSGEGTERSFYYTPEGVLVTEYIKFLKKDHSGNENMTKNIKRKYDAFTGNIIEEFINEYATNKVKSRKLTFDSLTGKLLSETIF